MPGADRVCLVENGRYLAEHIRGARSIELDERRSPALVRRCGGRRRRDSAVPHRRARSTPTVCSRRFCSPTSSAPPSRRRRSATVAGETANSCTTHGYGPSSSASAAARSTLRATGSPPLSTSTARAIRCACAAVEAITGPNRNPGGVHTGECEVSREAQRASPCTSAPESQDKQRLEVLVEHGEGSRGRPHRVRGSRNG